MTRKARTTVLVHAPQLFLQSLVDMIDLNIDIIEPPHYALVMLKVRESSQESLFYAGETLVTQCRVKYGSYIGLGILRGMEVLKSELLAKIDLVFQKNDQVIPQWIELIHQEKLRQDEIKIKAINKLLETKVDFQLMDKPYEL